jgi:RecB family endonuclease NucS
VKRFNVVILRDDGGVEFYPMKEWLRQHQEHITSGLDATSSTSHQLRNGLRKLGWSVQETPTEVRLLMPGAASSETAIDTVLGQDTEVDESEASETSFALEYQLRDFIAQNLNVITIEDKRLQLYVDPTGRDGIEFPSAVGPIDILAMDDSGGLVVFELKRDRSPDQAIGQLTRYMGWVRQTIGKGREVYGVIVARTIGDNLRYAASVVPNVSLFEYEIEFHLRAANELPENVSISG